MTIERQTDDGTMVVIGDRHPGALVRPIAPLEEIAAGFAEYQRVADRLIERSDVVERGGRAFRKRSAWRKLARAFGLSFEIRETIVVRDDDDRIVRAQVTARATAPNGQYADGIAVCDRYERCCQGWPCTVRTNGHRHCRASAEETCERAHFSNVEHDLVATASTRATNRAASDLLGVGEVSYEELGDGAGDVLEGEAFATTEQLDELASLLEPAAMTREELIAGYGKPLEEVTEAGMALLLERLRKVAAENVRLETDRSREEGRPEVGADVETPESPEEVPEDLWGKERAEEAPRGAAAERGGSAAS